MLPKIKIVNINDIDYLLFDTDDLISNCLCENGNWDSHILKFMEPLYENVEEPIILDIGANFGTYTLPIAKKIKDRGGIVVSYEPQRVIYYQLCSNVTLNRLDNCYLFNQAVGDYDGSIEIPDIDYDKIDNIGAFSLVKDFREKHNIEKYVKTTGSLVGITKLDSLTFDRPPCVIKIDVEGYELNVIRGGSNFLKKYDYPTILFEAWQSDWFKPQKEELYTAIKDLGYEIHNVWSADCVAIHPNRGKIK